jgi:hypothetical protein
MENLVSRNQIPPNPELAKPMTSLVFKIEGKKFHAVEVGHTDTSSTTVLHVPSIGLEVAGDAVYGDVHPFFGEANTTEKRKERVWAHNNIEALKTQTVVAGHTSERELSTVSSTCTRPANTSLISKR